MSFSIITEELVEYLLSSGLTETAKTLKAECGKLKTEIGPISESKDVTMYKNPRLVKRHAYERFRAEQEILTKCQELDKRISGFEEQNSKRQVDIVELGKQCERLLQFNLDVVSAIRDVLCRGGLSRRNCSASNAVCGYGSLHPESAVESGRICSKPKRNNRDMDPIFFRCELTSQNFRSQQKCRGPCCGARHAKIVTCANRIPSMLVSTTKGYFLREHTNVVTAGDGSRGVKPVSDCSRNRYNETIHCAGQRMKNSSRSNVLPPISESKLTMPSFASRTDRMFAPTACGVSLETAGFFLDNPVVSRCSNSITRHPKLPPIPRTPFTSDKDETHIQTVKDISRSKFSSDYHENATFSDLSESSDAKAGSAIEMSKTSFYESRTGNEAVKLACCDESSPKSECSRCGPNKEESDYTDSLDENPMQQFENKSEEFDCSWKNKSSSFGKKGESHQVRNPRKLTMDKLPDCPEDVVASKRSDQVFVESPNGSSQEFVSCGSAARGSSVSTKRNLIAVNQTIPGRSLGAHAGKVLGSRSCRKGNFVHETELLNVADGWQTETFEGQNVHLGNKERSSLALGLAGAQCHKSMQDASFFDSQSDARACRNADHVVTTRVPAGTKTDERGNPSFDPCRQGVTPNAVSRKNADLPSKIKNKEIVQSSSKSRSDLSHAHAVPGGNANVSVTDSQGKCKTIIDCFTEGPYDNSTHANARRKVESEKTANRFLTSPNAYTAHREKPGGPTRVTFTRLEHGVSPSGIDGEKDQHGHRGVGAGARSSCARAPAPCGSLVDLSESARSQSLIKEKLESHTGASGSKTRQRSTRKHNASLPSKLERPPPVVKTLSSDSSEALSGPTRRNIQVPSGSQAQKPTIVSNLWRRLRHKSTHESSEGERHRRLRQKRNSWKSGMALPRSDSIAKNKDCSNERSVFVREASDLPYRNDSVSEDLAQVRWSKRSSRVGGEKFESPTAVKISGATRHVEKDLGEDCQAEGQPRAISQSISGKDGNCAEVDGSVVSVDVKATLLAREILDEPRKCLVEASEVAKPNSAKIRENGLSVDEYKLAFGYRPKVTRTPNVD